MTGDLALVLAALYLTALTIATLIATGLLRVTISAGRRPRPRKDST